PAAGLVVKRMHQRGPDDILEQVARAPSLMLDLTVARAESVAMIRANAIGLGNGRDATLMLVERRADLAGLPLRRGRARRLTRADARHLVEGAARLQSVT